MQLVEEKINRDLTIREYIELHRLPGFQYLHSIFSKLPYAENEKDCEALLPWIIVRNNGSI